MYFNGLGDGPTGTGDESGASQAVRSASWHVSDDVDPVATVGREAMQAGLSVADVQ